MTSKGAKDMKSVHADGVAGDVCGVILLSAGKPLRKSI
jgi:hypothetical protein